MVIIMCPVVKKQIQSGNEANATYADLVDEKIAISLPRSLRIGWFLLVAIVLLPIVVYLVAPISTGPSVDLSGRILLDFGQNRFLKKE
jgi:hypothetical protein